MVASHITLTIKRYSNTLESYVWARLADYTYIHTYMCICTLFLCGSEEQRKQQILFKDIPVYSVFIQH